MNIEKKRHAPRKTCERQPANESACTKVKWVLEEAFKTTGATAIQVAKERLSPLVKFILDHPYYLRQKSWVNASMKQGKIHGCTALIVKPKVLDAGDMDKVMGLDRRSIAG